MEEAISGTGSEGNDVSVILGKQGGVPTALPPRHPSAPTDPWDATERANWLAASQGLFYLSTVRRKFPISLRSKGIACNLRLPYPSEAPFGDNFVV